MSTYITLAESKTHLRVDYTDDDTYIQSLTDMVEELVAMEIGEALVDIEVDDGVIPLPLKQAMLLMIGHFYLVREPITIGVTAVKIPFGYEFLVSPYKNWTIA